MAFDGKYLIRVAEIGLGRSLWHYHTLDATATVDTAAYFTGDAVKMLRVGDQINRTTWVTAIGDGGTVSTVGVHVVTSNDGTTVDVNDAVSLLGSDTD